MTEDAFVDTRVREFADHIQCDPELAQELYFKYDVDLTSDGADKMSLDAEIKALASLKRKLVTERDKLNTVTCCKVALPASSKFYLTEPIHPYQK